MTLHALYVGTPGYGINGITLHATEEEAKAELVSYLLTDEDHASDPPDDPDEFYDWVQELADDQDTDWHIEEVEVKAPKEVYVVLAEFQADTPEIYGCFTTLAAAQACASQLTHKLITDGEVVEGTQDEDDINWNEPNWTVSIHVEALDLRD